MKKWIRSAAAVAAFLFAMASLPAAEPNTLTAEEKAAGWRLLFDGRSLAGWRAYGSTNQPGAGWKAEDGLLKKLKGVRGGDIVTEQKFGDFELSWEWRLEAGGNNGVKYLVTEERRGAPGHEYQMIDDDGHPDGRLGPKRQTASFYEVLAPAADKPVKKPGEWNQSRIVIHGQRVEHWLNGSKLLEFDRASDAFSKLVAVSKYKDFKGFGQAKSGHLLLQDHGNTVHFRNIKVKGAALPNT